MNEKPSVDSEITATDTALWVIAQLKSAQSMMRSQSFEKAVALSSEAIVLCSSRNLLPMSRSAMTAWTSLSAEFFQSEPDLSAVLFMGHSLRGQALCYLGEQAAALEDFARARQLRPADQATLRYLAAAEKEVRRHRDQAALQRHLRSCHGTAGQGDVPCPQDAVFECEGCCQIGLSRRVRARYCGEECRAAAFPAHAAFHREFRRSRRWGCAETVCLAMLELAALDELPAPAAPPSPAIGLPTLTPTLTLLLVLPQEPQGEGAEEEDWLGEVLHLCGLLGRFVYPGGGLRCLQVVLAGAGAGAGGNKTAVWPVPGPDSIAVSVRCIPAEEDQVRRAALTCQACFLFSPGLFSLFFPQSGGVGLGWPATVLQALLCAAEPVPVVVTSSALDASTDRCTDDRDGHALFDELCLREFWSAHILTPTCPNPRFDPRQQLQAEGAGGRADPLLSGRRNRFYTIAKGRDPSAARDSESDRDRQSDLRRQLAVCYLRSRAGRDASSRVRGDCLRLADQLQSGAVSYAGQNLRQLMDMSQCCRPDLTGAARLT